MATYAPSDARTLPPTGTIAGGLGRCGEESVLAVAALRAAGIPARQVYTPRWAHTDDNHAWVEVFVDGGWHFMGACEPEPVLNLAWFNAPVSRAMLLHTLAFGDYSGPEDVIRRTHSFTEINVIKSYIPTRRTSVKVLDGQGFPVAGATVEFKIYNYAEFYTVAKTVTGVDGMAGLDTGIGDMLVWAHKDGRFGIAKASGEMTEIVLDRREGEEFGLDFDIVPPVENPIPSTATEEQVRLNALRLAYEDSVRTARPKGNAAVLAFRETYRIREGCAENMCDAGALLTSLSDKDMVDVRADVLEDAMAHCGEGFRPYRDCPRISYEPLLPYFGEIRQGLMACARKGSTSAGAVRREAGHAAGKHGTAGQGSLDWTPEHIMDWTLANIEVCDSLNPQGIYIPPVTVWRSRISDSRSRDIFFVAACRSMGFEARIDEVTGKTQYRDPVRCVLEGTGKNGMIQSPDVCGCTVEGTDRGDSKLQPQDCGRWVDVVWPENDADSGAAGKGDKSGKKGYVKSTYTPVSWLKDPLYYRHFTLSRIDRGSARLLAFDENGDAGWKELLSEPYPAETGYYLLTSGIRMADGTVSAHLEFFNVEKDRETTVPLVLRQQDGTIAVIGNINAEETFLPEGGREGVGGGHVGSVGGSGDQGCESVPGLDQGIEREGLGPFIGIGVDEKALACRGVFVSGPEEIVGLFGEDVPFGDLDLHAEEFPDGGFDSGVVERGVRLDVPVAFGLFEDVEQVVPVLGEVFDDGLVIGALERDDDLGFGGDIVLDGRFRLLDLGVNDDLDDIAMVSDHVLEPAFGDPEDIEEWLFLVQVGDRGGEDGAQGVSEFTVPLHLRTYDDEFIGPPLGGFFFVEGMECVASDNSGGDHQGEYATAKRFHGHGVRIEYLQIYNYFSKRHGK